MTTDSPVNQVSSEQLVPKNTNMPREHLWMIKTRMIKKKYFNRSSFKQSF